MGYIWDNKKIVDVLKKLSNENSIQHDGRFSITWKSDKRQEIWFKTFYIPNTVFKFSYKNFQMLYEGKPMRLNPTGKTIKLNQIMTYHETVYEVVPLNIGEFVLNSV